LALPFGLCLVCPHWQVLSRVVGPVCGSVLRPFRVTLGLRR